MSRYSLRSIFILFIFFGLLFDCGSAYANLCEDDAARTAMSHYIKHFSMFQVDRDVKVVVDSVVVEKVGGIGGMLNFYHVTLSKYYKKTMTKVGDFMLYEIDRSNGRIIGYKSVEGTVNPMKAAVVDFFASNAVISRNGVNYDVLAAIMYAYGDALIEAYRAGGPKAEAIASNAKAAVGAIASARPDLLHLTDRFMNDLASAMIVR